MSVFSGYTVSQFDATNAIAGFNNINNFVNANTTGVISNFLTLNYSFNFFGTTYNTITIYANGIIVMGTGASFSTPATDQELANNKCIFVNSPYSTTSVKYNYNTAYEFPGNTIDIVFNNRSSYLNRQIQFYIELAVNSNNSGHFRIGFGTVSNTNSSNPIKFGFSSGSGNINNFESWLDTDITDNYNMDNTSLKRIFNTSYYKYPPNPPSYYSGINVNAWTNVSGFSNSTMIIYYLYKPTLGTFTIPTKSLGDPPFSINNPSSNSSGAFSYSSSNDLIATINGNTITILAIGTVTVSGTQYPDSSKTFDSATFSTTFTVTQPSTVNPTITFSVPSKIYGNAPFTISATSNSAGSFTYSSANTSVATISGSTITIVGVGTSVITVNQAAATGYNAGSATSTLTVNNSTISNPTGINTNTDLSYFLTTNAIYGSIQGNITNMSTDLSTSTFKVLSNPNNYTIQIRRP